MALCAELGETSMVEDLPPRTAQHDSLLPALQAPRPLTEVAPACNKS
jgi:hypothetical protein